MANAAATISLLISATDLASPVIADTSSAVSKLQARVHAAANPMQALSEQTQRTADSIAATVKPLADLGKTIVGITGTVAGLGAMMGGAAYEAAKQYETAQSGLNKVLDASEGPASAYTGQLEKLALQYGANASALLASMAEFKQAGFTAKESAALVKNALDLMIAGDLEAGEASAALVRALKGFGAEATEAGRLVDVLNEVSNRYATDVRELAEGMAQISPIAAQLNLNFEETAAILTPIIEVFGSGSEAADGLKTGLLKLVDDTSSVGEALQSIGVAQKDANGNLRAGKAILADVSKAFLTLSEDQKLYVTEQLVGIDQAARMVKVFDNLSQSTKIAADAMQAAGSASKEVDIRLQTAESAARRTEESFRQAAVAIGTQYRDAVKGVVTATGELAQAFTTATKAGSLDGLFNAVKPQLQRIEDLFRQIANNIPAALAKVDFSRFAASIGALSQELGEQFQALFGAIDLTRVSGLSQAFQLAADSLAALIEFSAGFIDQLEPLFAVFGRMARAVVENSDGWARFAGQVAGVSQVVNTALPILADLASGLFSIVGTAADVALKIGFVVGAVKLLNAAGISVLPVLGRLAAGLGGLSAQSALALSAFVGLPTALLGVVAAAGAAGVAIGALTNTLTEAATGDTVGGWIFEATEGLKRLVATSDAATDAANRQLDVERARARIVAAAAAEEEAARRQAIEAVEAQRLANQQLLDQNDIQRQEAEKLNAVFAAMGMRWDELTGKLVPLTGAMSDHVEASLALRNALRDLGTEHEKLTGGITQGGQAIIAAFKRVSEDVTASSDVIRDALIESIDQAQTQQELNRMESLFEAWASRTGASMAQVGVGFDLIKAKAGELAQGSETAQKGFKLLEDGTRRVTDQIRAEAEAANDSLEAKKGQAEAAKKLAELKGNEYTAHLEAVKIQEIEVAQAKQTLAAQNALIANYEALGEAQLALALADRQLTAAEMDRLNSIAQTTEALKAQRTENEQTIELLSEELKSLRLRGSVAKESADQINAANETASSGYHETLAAAEEMYAAVINGAQVSVDQIKTLITQVEALGNSSAAATAKAKLEEAKAIKERKDYVKAQAGLIDYVINSWVKRLNDLSDAATATFLRIGLGEKRAAQDSETLTAAILRVSDEMSHLTKHVANNDSAFIRWATRLATIALNTEKLFLQQRLEAESTTAEITALTEKASLSQQELNRLAALAETAVHRFDLLSRDDLGVLKDALDTARQKLEAVKQEALDAKAALGDIATGLQDQLDEIAGRQADVEKRRYQEQLEQIDELAERAGEVGREAAEDARRRAAELHQYNLATIQERQAAEDLRREDEKAKEAQAAEAARQRFAEERAAKDEAHADDMADIEERRQADERGSAARQRAAEEALALADAIQESLSQTPERLGELINAAQPFVRQFDDAAAAADDLAKTVHDRLGDAIAAALEKMQALTDEAQLGALEAKRALESAQATDEASKLRLQHERERADIQDRLNKATGQARAYIQEELQATDALFQLELDRLKQTEQRARMEKEALAQSAAAAEAIESALAEGDPQLQTFIDRAQHLADSFSTSAGYADDLVEKIRAQLTGAIERATAAMDAFAEAARRQADQAEYDLERLRLEGDKEALSRLEFERELEALAERRRQAEETRNNAALADIEREQRAKESAFQLEMQRLQEQLAAERDAADERAKQSDAERFQSISGGQLSGYESRRESTPAPDTQSTPTPSVSVSSTLRDLGRIRLVTESQEIDLFAEMRQAEKLLEEIKKAQRTAA